MDESNEIKGMEDSSNAPREHLQTSAERVLWLGKDLERLMARLTASVEEVAREVEEAEKHSLHELTEFVDNLAETKLTLLKAFSEWSRLSGQGADPSVGSQVASLEITANELINRLRAEMEGVGSKVGPEISDKAKSINKEKNDSKVVRKTVSQVVRSKTTTRQKTGVGEKSPAQTESIVRPPITNESSFIRIYPPAPEESVVSPSYAQRLAAAPSKSVNRSTKGTTSRAGSKASSAAKLQAKLEETEVRVQEAAIREAREREQRVLNRDITRARQQREKQLQEQKRREELAAQERMRQEELAAQERMRQEELAAQERMRQEELDMQQMEEEAEEQKQRLADKFEEQEAIIRAKKAAAKAKLAAIEQYDEELANEQGAIDEENSESALPSEAAVGSLDKAAAFVGEMFKVQMQVHQNADENLVSKAEKSRTLKQVESLVRYSSTLPEYKKGFSKKSRADFPLFQPVIESSKNEPNCVIPAVGEHFTRTSRPHYTPPDFSSRLSRPPMEPENLLISNHSKKQAVVPNEPVANNVIRDSNLRFEVPCLFTREHQSISNPTNSNPIYARSNVNFDTNETSGIMNSTAKPNIDTVRLLPTMSKFEQDREAGVVHPPPATGVNSTYEARSPENFDEPQVPYMSPDQGMSHSDPVSNIDKVLETVCSQLAASRLPVAQPEIFDGRDPLAFPIWKLAFDALINHQMANDVDKLNLLNYYLGGEAKAEIRGYLMSPPSQAYKEAMSLLVDRYGNNFKITGAFQDRLKSWPKISGMDVTGLRKFIDFLKQCKTAKFSYPALRVLDDEATNSELLKKLPTWLARQWARKVSAHREATGEFPPFSNFVEFLIIEDKIANDPISLGLQKAEITKERRRGTTFAYESKNFSFASDSHKTTPNGGDFGTCTYCREEHPIEICRKFGAEPYEAKLRFIRENRLCFACLIKGHVSRECRSRRVCQICQGSHPTSMHREDSPPEGVTGNSNFADTGSIGYSHRIMVNQAQNPQRRGKKQRTRIRVNSPLGW